MGVQQIYRLVIAVSLSVGMASTSFASQLKLSPLGQQGALNNQSYLEEVRTSKGLITPTWVQSWEDLARSSVSEGDTSGIRYEAERGQVDFDRRKYHGTVGVQEELDYQHHVDSLGRDWFSKISDSQRKKTAQNLRGVLDKSPIVKKSLAAAMGVAALGYGQPVQTQIKESTSVSARGHVPYQAAEFTLQTSIVTGGFSYVGRPDANVGFGGSLFGQIQPISLDERIRYSLMRDIPAWNLRTSLTYGVSSQSVTASLGSELRPRLYVQLDTQVLMEAVDWSYRGAKESLSLRFNW